MALPYDVMFLGSFVYAGYRTLGKWFKFQEDSAKFKQDVDFFGSLDELLDQKAAEGNRGDARMGQSAAVSGQPQLWSEWGKMRPETRVKFLEEMFKVLKMTGQDKAWRHLRKAKDGRWSRLTPAQRAELVWAADALDWGFVDALVDAADAPPAGSLIWQITEPLPQLSEEPLRGRAPREDASALRELVAAEEAAVSKALRAGQSAAAAELAPVTELTVTETARKLAALREVLQGGLGLSTGGRAKRGQELMEALRGLSLIPQSSAALQLKEAAVQELDAEVDALIAPKAEEASKEKAAAEARARSLATAGVMQARVRAGRMTPAAAAALMRLVSTEASARLSDAAAAPGGLPPSAGAELLSTVALVGSALAALSSVLHDEAAAAGDAAAEPPAAVEEAIDLVEKIQRAVEGELARQAAANAAEEGEEEEGEGEEKEGGAGAAAALLQDLASAADGVAALPAPASGPADEGSADELLAEMQNDISTRVSESTAALASRHTAAIDAARDRERAALILRRGKAIAAPADDSATPAEDRPSSPIKRLAYAELYLRQLGARSLGGALPDATAFFTGIGGAGGLSGGLELDAASSAAAAALGRLVEEMGLIDDVIRLDLGPETASVLARIAAHLDALETSAEGANDDEADKEQSGEQSGAAEPGSPPAGAVGKAREALAALSGDAFVALGLTAAQYRTLAALREAVAALKGGEAEPAAYERGVAALRQASAQLGEIGAAIQVKLADTTDEALRDILQQQKDRSVDLYGRLQAFLAFEDSTREPAMAAVRALKAAADAASPQSPGAAGVEAAAGKAEAAEQQAAALAALLEKLPAPAGADTTAHAEAVSDATAALSSISEAAARLREGLAAYVSYAVLRERALATLARSAAGMPPADGTGDADAVTMPLQEMEAELNAPLAILADTDVADQADWEAIGNAAIARGQVAVVLVATSLVPGAAPGSAPLARVTEPAPGLPSGKAPLQLFCERIARAQQLAARAAHGASAGVTRVTHLYIMTSPDTHEQIERALEQRRHYGLDRSQVHLFTVDTATPCFDTDLKAVLSGPATLAMAPPGSGELLPALRRSGALSEMGRTGVRFLDINVVDDNLLWRPADPVFIGYASAARAAAAAKVVEPSDIGSAYAAVSDAFPAAAETGELIDSIALQAPAIGAYVFTLPAAERLADAYEKEPLAGLRLVPARGIPKRGAAPALPALPPNLPPQARTQAIAAAARAAEAAAAPRPVEGYALQRFLSDALRYGDLLPAGSIALLAVMRDEEFATLWGRGPHWAVEAPEGGTARLMGLHAGWVEASGGEVLSEEGIEVSPLVSYAGEDLAPLVEGVAFESADDDALQGAGAAATAARPPHNAGPWVAPLAVAYAGALAVALAKTVVKATGGGGPKA